jgi:hypothetical protein
MPSGASRTYRPLGPSGHRAPPVRGKVEARQATKAQGSAGQTDIHCAGRTARGPRHGRMAFYRLGRRGRCTTSGSRPHASADGHCASAWSRATRSRAYFGLPLLGPAIYRRDPRPSEARARIIAVACALHGVWGSGSAAGRLPRLAVRNLPRWTRSRRYVCCPTGCLKRSVEIGCQAEAPIRKN